MRILRTYTYKGLNSCAVFTSGYKQGGKGSVGAALNIGDAVEWKELFYLSQQISHVLWERVT